MMSCIILICTFAFALVLLFDCNIPLPIDHLYYKCEVNLGCSDCVGSLLVFHFYHSELCVSRDLQIDPG